MIKVKSFLTFYSLLSLLLCNINICNASSVESPKQSSEDEHEYRMLNKSFSNLVSIKLKELETMNNWQIIDLSHNSIEFIDTPELLQKQNELEFLQIDFNAKFNKGKNEKIFSHKNLKRMSCKGCGFTEIQSQHFTGIDKLAELNLSANKIVRIDAESFSKNGYLRILDLSENRIVKLSPSTFSQLRKFEEVILSSNPIELTIHKTFLKSESLKRLIMDNCTVIEIYKETFSELKSIELINLNDNKIENIEVASFVKNGKLKSLFIENNRLKLFPVSILDTSKYLEELCADNNSYVNNKEFQEFTKRYTARNLRTMNCSSNVKYFIENLFSPEVDDNEILLDNNGTLIDEKSSKFIKFHKGISNFFIGSYLTIILIIQAAGFVLISLYLIKIVKYESLGTGNEVNYANTILNDNDIYKVYKLNE